MTFDAIIPAGGLIDGEFATRVGASHKALIKFDEETILSRTIRALRDTGVVGRIVIASTDEVRNSPDAKLADLFVQSGNSGPSSILNGLKELMAQPNPPKKVVIVTSDLPFLTPELITQFIEACPKDVDLGLPLITRGDYQTRFPHSSSTFIP